AAPRADRHGEPAFRGRDDQVRQFHRRRTPADRRFLTLGMTADRLRDRRFRLQSGPPFTGRTPKLAKSYNSLPCSDSRYIIGLHRAAILCIVVEPRLMGARKQR